METVWAAVIGAFVALVSSSLSPWLREWATEKKRNESQYQSDLRTATLEAMQALSEMYYSAGTHVTASQAISQDARILRLTLVARGDDAALGSLIDNVAAILVVRDDQIERAPAYRALNQVVPMWFRGESTADEVFETYTRTFEELQRNRESEGTGETPTQPD